jgi:hypothetical protein
VSGKGSANNSSVPPTSSGSTNSPEQDAEELADAIVKIAKTFEGLLSSRLKESTLLLLVSTASGVNKTDCKKVIEACRNLATKYLEPARRKTQL